VTVRRRVCAAAGALAVATGLFLAGAVAWQWWAGEVGADQAQQDASSVLVQQWRSPAPTQAGPVPVGTPLARLDIPALGPGWNRVLLEGVDQDTLARGPGHYPGTGELGRPGNYAIAGHRVGQGAPFDAAGELRPCDPIVVTTAAQVLTYRVLPFDGLPVACSLPFVPGTVGREIVDPDDVAVIGSDPAGPALLTITTCHPRFSARQRLVIHAVLTDTQPRQEP
jgi:sortase A